MPPVEPTVRVPQTATPQELTFPEEDFRAKQPAAGPPRPFRMPPVKPFTLKNGIAVYLVEQHNLPLVSMELNFDGGELTDPKGKAGLASVCMAMLTEGTAQLDKIAYTERLADTASTIAAYSSDETVSVSLSSLRKHLEPTFAQLVETIRAPGFRASDFDRMIKRRIEGVRQSKGNPASVATRVSDPVRFGTDHPFGAVVTEASLAAITLDDCKVFAQTWLRPKRAQLFVMGDITEPAIRGLFDAPELASWTGAAPPPPAAPSPQPLAGRIFFVDIPGAAQSNVSYLQFGPQRADPEYFANTLMGAVLGGGFTSRINMNLREDKGYSYGARGSFAYTKSYGMFSVSSQVASNATYQTILEIDRELRGLWAGQPGYAVKPEELEREKNAAILGLPGRFATAQAALGQYRALIYFGLPLDYYSSYVANVEQVSASAVMAAAASQLRPNQGVYLVVGNGSEKVIERVRSSGGAANPALAAGPSGGGHPAKDVPYTKNGRQLTLREALAELAARGDVGAGGLVELDADGRAK